MNISLMFALCRFDYEKEEVVVFRKNNKGTKLACFAGRGLVGAPHTVVGEFMIDPESSFLWDKFLSVSLPSHWQDPLFTYTTTRMFMFRNQSTSKYFPRLKITPTTLV